MFDSSSGFVHLDARSYFSIKDGAFSPEDLALRAAALGMAAVALTDRDGLYGAPRFSEACRQVSERVAPIRPIHGATLTVRGFGLGPDGAPPETGRTVDRSVVLLAKD
ncbi:MAG TPA: PHP domain-containing protein, partial [Actinomycetota bacterium]